MEIALATLATKETDSYSVYTNENKKEYCNKHRYDLHTYLTPLDSTRPPSWSKILIIIDTIRNGKNDNRGYDFVCWLDADAWIEDMDLKLESLIDRKHDLFICEDKEGINTGFFLMPCNAKSIHILNDWYNRTEWIDHIWWDNKAAHEWHKTTKSKVKILPKYLNHYIDEVNEQTKIIHLAGCTNNHRAAYFKSKKELSL